MTDRVKPVVMKFGGTSVADPEAIRRLTAIVLRRSGPRLVVVSALAGITDRLLEMAELAATGFAAAASRELSDIDCCHRGAASVVMDSVRRSALTRKLRQTIDELDIDLRGIVASSELTARVCDRVVATGELLSSQIVAAALQDAGLRGVWVDARRVLVTDGAYSHARPLTAETRARVSEELSPYLDHGYVPVVGGFVGASASGETTTLGRGGSDYSLPSLARVSMPGRFRSGPTWTAC